mmetsp:Transcript_618/g.1419  ORF Transcript_618/g.1419 Transcript_618/m.1419 type:complete len:294 (+) Transcript_618:57-938(+)
MLRQAVRTMASTQEVAVTVTGSADLFGRSGQAASYAKFRPRYPNALYESLVQQIGTPQGPNQRWQCALDLACGSGQVIGVDQSHEQLKNAQYPEAGSEGGKVEYQAGSAYALTDIVPAQSLDLVTCAQAFHWMDAEKVLQEVAKVLKPGGTLAIMGYSRPAFMDPKLEAAYKGFYFQTLGSGLKPGEKGCYWEIDRSRVDGAFPEMTSFGSQFLPPSKDSPASKGSFMRQWFDQPQVAPLGSFFGYLRSNSAYQTYLEAHPDPLPKLLEEMAMDSEAEVQYTFPCYVLSAQRC